MTTRQEKVNSLIQREIAGYLQEEAYEGITGIVTITGVETTADLEHAQVFYSVVNQDPAEVEKILQSHIYQLQGRLTRQLQMRKVPRVKFLLDESGEYAAQIGKIIKDIRDRKQ